MYYTCACIILIFSRKSDCLGCAVLLCLVVCLTLLASFFLPSLISHLLYTMYMCILHNNIFVVPDPPDECDAMLGRRGEGEHDAMRRLKNEFLQCFDGVGLYHSSLTVPCTTPP